MDISPERRVLTRDNALALGHRLLALASDRLERDGLGVRIEHTARTITRMANGQVSSSTEGDWLRIAFHSRFGSGLPVWVHTTQLTDTALRSIISRAALLPPPSRPGHDGEAEDPDDDLNFTYSAREFMPVSLWHDTTVQAMQSTGASRDADGASRQIMPMLEEQLRTAHLTGAATVNMMARSALYLYQQGLTAFSEETDCEVTVTARTPDGKASGWYGQANRDWTKITPNTIVEHAIDMATRSRNPVALEPGRRMAILGPAAVAQLVDQMAYAFDAQYTLAPRLDGNPGTPFALPRHTGPGPHSKLDMRVIDPRLNLVSDPADPLGGFPPFFEFGGVEYQLYGYPLPATTWIERGVLKQLAYGVLTGLGRHLVPRDVPRSAQVTPVAGTPTATIDEMIANCDEGIYVNRLADVTLLDRSSGMMTGVTTDGCFLIKDRKVVKPVTNFRFVDSPFFRFNAVEMIGVPERVAFGPQSGYTDDEWSSQRWPHLPVSVPPLMVRDFNFAALANAV